MEYHYSRRYSLSYQWIANEAFSEFQFVDDRHRAAAVAMILTCIVAHLMDIKPGFLYTAPTPGTGKTELVQIIGYLVYSKSVGASAYPKSSEEMSKTLVAVLRAYR